MIASPLSLFDVWRTVLSAGPTTSLTDAIAIACSVHCDVNMQVIGVRSIRAWTKRREPAARGSPDRANDVSRQFVSVWFYGNNFAV